MESELKPGKKKESVKNPVKSSPTTSRWRNEQNQVNLKHFDINWNSYTSKLIHLKDPTFKRLTYHTLAHKHAHLWRYKIANAYYGIKMSVIAIDIWHCSFISHNVKIQNAGALLLPTKSKKCCFTCEKTILCIKLLGTLNT